MTGLLPNDSAQIPNQGLGSHRNALVIEDVEYVAAGLKSMLSNLGIEVDYAPDGIEALRQLQSKPYDLAFLDWDLPGLNGFEVAIQYRESEGPTRHTIIIATTSCRSSEKRKACFRAGMDGYIAKPVTPEKIELALKEINAGRNPDIIRGPVKLDELPHEGIDTRMLQFLTENSTNNLSSHIERFLRVFSEDCEKIRTAVTALDREATHHNAHRVLSHCKFVRYEILTKLVSKLQNKAYTATTKQLTSMLEEIEVEYAIFRLKLLRIGGMERCTDCDRLSAEQGINKALEDSKTQS